TDDWNSAQTRGTYYKMTTSAKFSQGLRRGMVLDLSINTQHASRNLDGSEKMMLGGPGAVRAYSNDTVSADSGYVASATLNIAVPVVKGLAVQAFYDRAQAAAQKFVRSGANRVTMDGYGAGVSYTVSQRATLSLSHAIRVRDDPLLGDQPRAMTWA
ncbi:BamA/TamA family outer membrane protein, partial [Pandoraea nosoerga]